MPLTCRLRLTAQLALAALATAPLAAPAAAQAPAPASEELVEPELLSSVEAAFPPAAFAAGLQADVILQIDISETGAVTNPIPVEAAYYGYDDKGNLVEETADIAADKHGFISSALAAVTQYKFKPAILKDAKRPEGVAIPVQVTWKVGFVISEQEIQRQLTEKEAQRDQAVASDPTAPINFQGQLLVRGVRDPLFGVKIKLRQTAPDSGLALEVTTDAEGRFAVPGLKSGTWEIKVDEPGFRLYTTTEQVEAAQLTEATLYIERTREGLVTRTTGEPPPKEVTRRILTVREIQRIPGNNNDAIKVVQNLPGVARAAFGGGQVIVRGSAPEDTAFFVDGMQLLAIYHFGGLRSVFPSEFLSSVNLYPGAFSSQYGRVTGGVIDVRTKTEKLDRLRGHFDVNFIDSSFYLEGPIGKDLDFQVGARRSYIDFLLEPLSETLGLSFTTAPRYYDWQGKVRWYADPNHTASLFIYGSDDLLDFVNEDQRDIPPDLRGGIKISTAFQGAIARLDSKLAPNVTNQFQFQYQPQQQGFSLGQGLYFNLNVDFFSIRDTVEWKASDTLTLRGGTDPKYFSGDIKLKLPRPPKEGETPVGLGNSEIFEITESFDPAIYNLYTEAEWQPVDRLLLIPGLRYEYYNRVERAAADPRLAARYNLTDELVVKAAYGRHHISPTPDETSTSLGNPTLNLEQADHYVLGAEYAFTPYLSFTAEAFFKDLDNLVTRSNGPLIYDNAAEGRIYGGEFFLRHQLANNFFGWVAYTISQSERKDRPGEDWRLFDFDQTHILNLIASYDLPSNWSIGARYRYVTGSPNTEIIAGVFDSDSNDYVRVEETTVNASRNKAFQQLDVRVDKRWVFDTWTLNTYLDLQNAINYENQEGVNYQYDFEDSLPATGIPIFPSIGIRGEF